MSLLDQMNEAEVLLSKKPWWSRLAGSQFVAGLANYINQMVIRCEQVAVRLHQESFLSTASKASSILAAAEDRAYVGRKITPSIGKLAITNVTDSALSVPVGASMIGPNNLSYVIREAANITPGATAQVSAAQLSVLELKATVGAEEKYIELSLPKDVSAATFDLEVFVTEPGLAQRQWTKRYMFRLAGPKDRVYTEFYRPTEQLGVRFGNGLRGKIPPAGSIITLKAWQTVGESVLIDNQELEFTGVHEYLNDRLKIKTSTSILGGAARETIEETRQGALYATLYDDQIVWRGDFIHFVRTNVGGLTWINAWGEQDQERQDGFANVDNINRIFLSAHAPAAPQSWVRERILGLFKAAPELNTKYTYVDAVGIPFSFTLTAKVTAEKDRVMVEQEILSHLMGIYGPDAEKRPLEVLEKDLWTETDDLNLASRFVIEPVGLDAPLKLNEFLYLDKDMTTITITYE